MDGKFVHDPGMDFVSYDKGTDIVTIAEDLMVPVPVYNYARYIREVSRSLVDMLSQSSLIHLHILELCRALP